MTGPIRTLDRFNFPPKPRPIVQDSTRTGSTGNTTLVTPTSGNKLCLCWVGYCNSGANPREFAVRFGATGDKMFYFDVPGEQGILLINLLGAEVMGAIDEPLVGWVESAADYAYFNYGYMEIESPDAYP